MKFPGFGRGGGEKPSSPPPSEKNRPPSKDPFSGLIEEQRRRAAEQARLAGARTPDDPGTPQSESGEAALGKLADGAERWGPSEVIVPTRAGGPPAGTARAAKDEFAPKEPAPFADHAGGNGEPPPAETLRAQMTQTAMNEAVARIRGGDDAVAATQGFDEYQIAEVRNRVREEPIAHDPDAATAQAVGDRGSSATTEPGGLRTVGPGDSHIQTAVDQYLAGGDWHALTGRLPDQEYGQVIEAVEAVHAARQSKPPVTPEPVAITPLQVPAPQPEAPQVPVTSAPRSELVDDTTPHAVVLPTPPTALSVGATVNLDTGAITGLHADGSETVVRPTTVPEPIAAAPIPPSRPPSDAPGYRPEGVKPPAPPAPDAPEPPLLAQEATRAPVSEPQVHVRRFSVDIPAAGREALVTPQSTSAPGEPGAAAAVAGGGGGGKVPLRAPGTATGGGPEGGNGGRAQGAPGSEGAGAQPPSTENLDRDAGQTPQGGAENPFAKYRGWTDDQFDIQQSSLEQQLQQLQGDLDDTTRRLKPEDRAEMMRGRTSLNRQKAEVQMARTFEKRQRDAEAANGASPEQRANLRLEMQRKSKEDLGIERRSLKGTIDDLQSAVNSLNLDDPRRSQYENALQKVRDRFDLVDKVYKEKKGSEGTSKEKAKAKKKKEENKVGIRTAKEQDKKNAEAVETTRRAAMTPGQLEAEIRQMGKDQNGNIIDDGELDGLDKKIKGFGERLNRGESLSKDEKLELSRVQANYIKLADKIGEYETALKVAKERESAANGLTTAESLENLEDVSTKQWREMTADQKAKRINDVLDVLPSTTETADALKTAVDKLIIKDKLNQYEQAMYARDFSNSWINGKNALGEKISRKTLYKQIDLWSVDYPHLKKVILGRIEASKIGKDFAAMNPSRWENLKKLGGSHKGIFALLLILMSAMYAGTMGSFDFNKR